jgi:hypothetical protein
MCGLPGQWAPVTIGQFMMVVAQTGSSSVRNQHQAGSIP